MEYESDCVKCGICCIENAKLLTLSAQEQVLVEKLFQCIALHRSSRLACKFCLEKVYNFKNFLKEIFVNQVKLERTHDRKMQEESNTIQDENAEEAHYDVYNCKCSNCQGKYGSLPLLVDVIEQENKTEEPKPSTSQDSPSSSSSSSPKKKLMQCSHCNKQFTHKGDLNKHTRTHTGEQPFFCTLCDKKFAHTSNLTRHLRLHSGDRPFECDICHKKFGRKDKLELHKRSRTCRRN